MALTFIRSIHMRHQTRRVRHNSRRRTLRVLSKTHVTPKMLRIAFGGDDLADFTSPSADEHIKLYVPGITGAMEARDFTPRRFDPALQQLTIDFALHLSGLVTEWALTTTIGDDVEVSGPRGSLLIPEDFDRWMLVGEETALPSIGRRAEGFAKGTPVTTIVAVCDHAERQVFDTVADYEGLWVHRSSGEANNPDPLMNVLSRVRFPPGDGFVWIAAEAGAARAAKEHIIQVLRHPRQWLRAPGAVIRGRI